MIRHNKCTFTYLTQQSYDRIATPISFPKSSASCSISTCWQTIRSSAHVYSWSTLFIGIKEVFVTCCLKRRASLARDKFFKRFTVVSLQNFSRTFCRAINTEIAFNTLKLKPATVKQAKDKGVRRTEIGSVFFNR